METIAGCLPNSRRLPAGREGKRIPDGLRGTRARLRRPWGPQAEFGFLITALLRYNLPAVQLTHFKEECGFYAKCQKESLKGDSILIHILKTDLAAA